MIWEKNSTISNFGSWRVFWILLFSFSTSLADFKKDEASLYPAGSPSADTLKTGEFVIGPPWGGWIAGGVTDKITLGWDYPAALFAGLPAFILRTNFWSSPSFEFSFELYGANWGSSYIDKRNSNFLVEHQGFSGWAHALMAFRFSDSFRLLLYGGTSYANYEKYSPNQGASFATSLFSQAYSPDWGLTLECLLSTRLKFLLNGMSGNSFYFTDQISRKTMAVYAFDWAPFSTNAVGILRTLRIELAALWLWMPIAGDYQTSLALPIYPWLYWQFSL